MSASQIRALARENLKGKWGKAAIMTLCFCAITFAISLVCSFIPLFGSIALFVVEIPISYGIIVSFIKLKRDEEVGYVDFLTIGFSSFANVWKVSGYIFLKMIVPIAILIGLYFLFFIIGAFSLTMYTAYSSSSSQALNGIFVFAIIFVFITCVAYFACLIWLLIKSYLYSLSFFILYDHPDWSSKDIVEESERLMKGNRWRYFCLLLSFIGWILLSVLSLYIGFLWTLPYMFIAYVYFYEHLANKENVPNVSSSDLLDNNGPSTDIV